MKTSLHTEYANTEYGIEADAILRTCVHCGFCNATCPTYVDLGDERDGPRGRIYLIKQVLETNKVSSLSLSHLDRCLTCLSCETTCPSSVKYGRLLDIGRSIVEGKVKRLPIERFKRWIFLKILPFRKRVSLLLAIGRLFKPVLPAHLRSKIPQRIKTDGMPSTIEQRTMILLAGCVQSEMTPKTNIAAIRVMQKLGITLHEEKRAGCCGALSYHMSEHEEGLEFMRKNINAWWPGILAGAEAVVSSASGCGAMVKEYGYLLRNDPAYAEKAKRVSELARDLTEVVLDEDMEKLDLTIDQEKTAIHCPCTLQNFLGLPENIEKVMAKVGFVMTGTVDNHLCCGSAGAYSLLQPELSQRLLDKKLAALTIGHPDRIVTANVGCQLHLSSKAKIPVQHWIELLDYRS